jgi:hypothetical protein
VDVVGMNAVFHGRNAGGLGGSSLRLSNFNRSKVY